MKSVVKSSEVKNVEQVVVIPKKPQVHAVAVDDKASPPLRRAASDGHLSKRLSSRSTSSAVAPTNFLRLLNNLKMKRAVSKAVQQRSVIDSLMKSKAQRRQGRFAKLKLFLRKLSCLFMGPMFYRHGFRFIIFLEVFAPVLIFLFVSMAFTSGISWKKAYSERKAANALASDKRGGHSFTSTTTEEMLIQKFKDRFVDRFGRVYIAFSPANQFTNEIMTQVLTNLQLDPNVVKVLPTNPHSSVGAAGVGDASEVLEHALLHRMDAKAHRSPVGIDFTLGEINPMTGLPHLFKFVIRTFDNTISETEGSHPYVKPPRKAGLWDPPYVESGFLGLQLAIQQAFMKKVYQTLNTIVSKELESITDLMERMRLLELRPTDPDDPAFPEVMLKLLFTPNYFDQSVRQLVALTICLILCCSYTGLSFFIVRQIVIEGQSGIKEFLRLHHMAKYLHWVAYFFHSLVFRFITAIGITTTLFIDYGQGPIFTHSSPIIIYGVIFLHLMSLSSFNFLIGSLLSSVTFSGVISITICLFSFVFPYCLLKSELLSDTGNLILSLVFPNWALWNAISEMVDYECDDLGVNWSNVQILSHDKVLLTYLQCIIIFAAGFLVYFLVAMVIDLTSKTLGQHEFSCQRLSQKVLNRINRSLPQRTSGIVSNNKPSVPASKVTVAPTPSRKISNLSKSSTVFEPAPPQSLCLAKITNLSKFFGPHKLVLEDVNLDIVQGEILAVLGAADAGKSTLLQCLAGIIKPNVGTITISGIDMVQERSKAMEFIGYCPQDVVLFNILSVQEHLILCYKLRGLPTKSAKTFADGLMQLLRLTEVRKFSPGSLTPDERRKLAIALCLVDRPSMVLLDEPTNGMEPLTKHEIWTILKSLKSEGHTIVMTTSMMDEAEFLADRVALLSCGQLICYGTPSFLQERCGTGYYLRIVPNPAKFSLEAFQAFASTHFPTILQEANEKTMFDHRNFLLVLPPEVQTYPGFFNALEESKESLGVTSYGTQIIGLSDIFMKMSQATSTRTNTPDVYIRKTPSGNERSAFWGEIPDYQVIRCSRRQQFCALIEKLWRFGLGSRLDWVWQVFLPLALIWITVWESHCFVRPPLMPTEREFLLGGFPLARAYFREQGIFTDSMEWRDTLSKILGDQGEYIRRSAKLEDIVKEDAEIDRTALNYTLEKRMLAIELVATASPQGTVNARPGFFGYYASGSLHSPPLVLSIMGNLFLKAVTAKMNDSTIAVPYRMIVGNMPFPTNFESRFDISCGLTCLMFGLCISFAIGFLISLLMIFPVLERRTGMKQLQLMTGCSPFTYWSTYYCMNAAGALVTSVVIVLIFVLNGGSMYRDPATFGTLTIIVILFLCWSGIPWVYYLSTLVPRSVGGIMAGFCIHLGFGFLPILILETGFEDEDSGFGTFCRYFFHLFPPYTITSAIYTFFETVSRRSLCTSVPIGLQEMCTLDRGHRDSTRYRFDTQQIFDYMIQHDTNLAKCCEKICEPTNVCAKLTPFFPPLDERWERPRLLMCVVAFLLQGVIYWCLLIVIESRIIPDYCHNMVLRFLKNRVQKQDNIKEPADIAMEKAKIQEILDSGSCPEGTLMACQNLTKSSIEQMIISDVNIRLHEGDIVALVGGSGCGKSVVVKMLAGEIFPTRGLVVVENLELHKNRKELLRRLSYCPQDDALFDSFTGLQMLQLMAILRGLPPNLVQIHAKKWLQLFDLVEAANDKCGSYNKGMRRRLCIAMTLIAGNSIILLDEPTRSLDAMAKLRLWSILRSLADRGHGIIFTSANAAESERNATRLLVLSEGNVQCIGTPEGLRQRFSKGFTLLIQLEYDRLTPIEMVSTTVGRVNDLKKTVEKKFKRAILRDEQGNLLLYFISAGVGEELTLGGIFAAAEEIKEEHNDVVANYFISQSTLDDVFVLLTNRYKDMDIPRNQTVMSSDVTQEEAEVEAIKEATKLKPFD